MHTWDPNQDASLRSLNSKSANYALFEQHDICIEIISEMHRSAYPVSLN